MIFVATGDTTVCSKAGTTLPVASTVVATGPLSATHSRRSLSFTLFSVKRRTPTPNTTTAAIGSTILSNRRILLFLVQSADISLSIPLPDRPGFDSVFGIPLSMLIFLSVRIIKIVFLPDTATMRVPIRHQSVIQGFVPEAICPKADNFCKSGHICNISSFLHSHLYRG